MLICMIVDFADPLSPYGGLPFLFSMQSAWGVYYLRQDLDLEVDCQSMMEWLLRRGNTFMRHAVYTAQVSYKGVAC